MSIMLTLHIEREAGAPVRGLGVTPLGLRGSLPDD
jgi:hypothetical protein